jgi:hypothetical protein
MTDDELLAAVRGDGEIGKLRRYTGGRLPLQSLAMVSMRVARMMWTDKTDEEIEAMLRANGYIRSDEVE